MSNEQEEVLLTAEGLEKLKEELENLKTVRRKEVAARIKQALSSVISVKILNTTMPKMNRPLLKEHSRFREKTQSRQNY